MREREPSRTALAVAAYRAVHQVLEQGRIFKDPFAVPIIGERSELFQRNLAAPGAERGMRFFVAARARIAEDALGLGVEQRGVGQLVVLGAGLDTFAYRNPFERRLKVFEVDHPATQAWKRRRLDEGAIAVPDGVTYAPVDFERENLSAQLAKAGLDPDIRTFFTWMGVVAYLTKDAARSTLSQIAAHPGGAEIAFDYSEPLETIDPPFRARQQRRAARVAAAGEPFLSHFAPVEIHAMLRAAGFDLIDDLDLAGIRARLPTFPSDAPVSRRGEPARRSGGHVILAATAFGV